VLQYLYTDNIEEKKELMKGITLANKDKFQLTPLPQVHTQILQIHKENALPTMLNFFNQLAKLTHNLVSSLHHVSASSCAVGRA
jgi:hypothetical protein